MRRTIIPGGVIVLFCGVATAVAQVRHEIHFPDLPDYQTLVCDFHTHTVYSDGTVWPTVRVDEAWREGLDAIALTDHIEYQPHEQDLHPNHNRPYELAARRGAECGVLLIRGAEITRETPPGHFNALFLNDVNPLDTPDFLAVFEQAAQQRAFVFWNHPGWQGPEKGRWGPEQTTLLEKRQLHGIEVCNETDYYADAHRWAMEKNLTLLGNSDIHDPSLNSERTPQRHRTLTLVFAQERSVAAVREALLAGRTAVWFGNQLIGREEHLAPMFAAAVRINAPYHQRDATIWVALENRCELDIELERVEPGRPARIRLPARATTLVRFPAAAQQPAGLAYRAANFLIGPNQALSVQLVIPAP